MAREDPGGEAQESTANSAIKVEPRAETGEIPISPDAKSPDVDTTSLGLSAQDGTHPMPSPDGMPKVTVGGIPRKGLPESIVASINVARARQKELNGVGQGSPPPQGRIEPGDSMLAKIAVFEGTPT